MIKPLTPLNEKVRLETLRNLDILDTAQEAVFDSITKLAALVLEVPICLISLVDENRQWFKSHHGLEATETPRDISFCGHAINQTEIFSVEDSSLDERFKDNPLVLGNPHVAFYAGAPLITSSGIPIGTLCIIDHKPRVLTSEQAEKLKILGDQVMYMIQAHVEIKKKEQTHELLTKLSENLPGFIYTYQAYPDGRSSFPYSSNSICEIYEFSPEDVNDDASKVLQRIHPDDLENVLETIQLSAKELSKWTCDYRVVLPTLGEKWLRGSANPEKAKDGSIIWHGYISDITEQKKQEEVVIHSLKMATLGEMAAGIAHEINNPLTIIKSTSQLINASINRREFNEEKLLKSFDKIDQTTERISKIIKGLRFFSGQSRNELSKIESIQPIIEDTISLCLEKFKVNNVDLRCIYPKELQAVFISCRAVEISQVILNLLNNAFDAIESFENKCGMSPVD
jgi:hypothetical protein